MTIHRRRLAWCLLIAFLILSMTGISAFADSDKEYSISGYDVNVRINTDGSLDITESVKFTFYGGFNNIMLLIDKEEGEEVEVKNVYLLRKQGYIECDRLSAGQWDANVFSGTYSVIQENNDVKLKVYGTFSNRYGSIVVQYSVKNAIKRYSDVAEYKRIHIPKNWEGRISNINITVNLPAYADKYSIVPFLHGVLVGRKTVDSRRTITYNVPDTVPGEYVETRIIFPESVVPNAHITDDNSHMQTIAQEETDYENSDKADLLKARENYAKEAGRKAWSDRMTQRVRFISSVFSILASLFGLYLLFFIQRKIHQLKKMPMPPEFKGIEELSPAEVRLLLANGSLGGRAILGNLMRLASKGYLTADFSSKGTARDVITFRMGPKSKLEELSSSDQYLMGWVAGSLDEKGIFDPKSLLDRAKGKESAASLKRLYDEWEDKALDDYNNKNMIDTGLLKYRNIGLVTGAILFLLGCVIPVTLSIWGGYLMFPVGLALILYTVRIRKHTDFGIAQHRIWKELKKRIIKSAIALDTLPSYMADALALLAYCLALGTEKELGLVEVSVKKNEKLLSEIATAKEIPMESRLSGLVKNTLQDFSIAISSVQDMAD
ncbi:MAG: DUF2207 domain-containing protein [Clostridia bacterium]|nr:DUF2207 domain-containing protein [Clostridia bacterium]